MTIYEFLYTEIPMYGVLICVFCWFLFFLEVRIFHFFNSRSCGYNCELCKSWDCEAKACRHRQKKRTEQKENSR